MGRLSESNRCVMLPNALRPALCLRVMIEVILLYVLKNVLYEIKHFQYFRVVPKSISGYFIFYLALRLGFFTVE